MTHTMQSCLMLMLQKHKNEPKIEDKYHDQQMQPYPEMVKYQIGLSSADAYSGVDTKNNASESEQQSLTDKFRHLFFNKGQGHHH